MSSAYRISSSLVAVSFALTLAACGDETGSQRQMPAATVTTTAVEIVPWSDSIQALGTAYANESVMVTAKVTETVARVNFSDGDHVEAGDVLVELSGRAELAELAEARAAYEDARQQLSRAEQLAERQLVAASDLDSRRASAQAARARMDTVRARLGDRVITAPFAGTLGFRQVSPGTLVTPGTTIASLDDISRIKLDFSVPETFVSALAPGQAIEARSAAFPDQRFDGIVQTIGSRVDPVSRALTVRAEIGNPDGRLRPGMLMSVRIIRAPRDALVIPEIALVQVGLDAFVYRVRGDETVEQVRVHPGQRRTGEVEIVDGLQAGDRIVVHGTVKLRDGARITEAGEAPDGTADAA